MARYFALLVVLLSLTACHDGEWHWIQAEGPEVVIQPDVLPEEVGFDEPEPFPVVPCEVIKGNISGDGRKLYHTVDSPNYNQVKIDEDANERFFCSEDEAKNAGWVKAGG